MKKRILYEFAPHCEIYVDEGYDTHYNKPIKQEDYPRIEVLLEFGIELRVGDVLFFSEEDVDLPKWILQGASTNLSYLHDKSITITQRNISFDHISFYAKFS